MQYRGHSEAIQTTSYEDTSIYTNIHPPPTVPSSLKPHMLARTDFLTYHDLTIS
jgi:hypothetical protein